MPAVLLAGIGFVAGLVAGLLFSWAPWSLAPLAAAAALVLLRRRHRGAALLATLAAGVVWGGVALHLRSGDCRLHWPSGQRVSLVIEPRDRTAGDGVRRMTVRAPAACAGPVAVLMPRGDTTSTVLAVTGTWQRDPRFAASVLPGRPERAGRLQVMSVRVLPQRPGLRSRLRLAAELHLERLFGTQRWPLAAALTVSPEAALPAELRATFRTSGLTHILSISGFHVAILAGALIVILRACRLGPDASRIAGTVLVVLYVWVLGYPAPALRSAALLVVWCWARARQRPPLPAALLASTALAVALVDPWAVLEPGPWLSFGGVWGCTAASGWWSRLTSEARSRRSRRALRWLTPVSVSVGATLATSPVQALAFGTITPVGILANLAAIPLAAFAVPALALALAIASLPLPGAMALAAYPAAAGGLALDGLERAASWAAGVSWATFTAEPRVPIAVIGAAVGYWLLRPGPRRRRAGAVLAARLMRCGALVLAAACWVPVFGGASGGDGDGGLTLHFLAVGQGDATAIRTPHGQWLLIDGGPRMGEADAGARYVVPFLRRHGVRRLAVLVASHGDADHLGGVPAVLEALPVDVAVEQGMADGRPLYREFLGDVVKGGGRWHAARAGEHFAIDGVTIRIWHPDSATIADGWEANENSVVLTVEYGAFRALFGGDAGRPMEALRAGAIGAVTLLKVGHHGSRSASGPDWLAALRPALCIIEVGDDNRYGHPHAEVVERLERARCGVWRTDRQGIITVQTDGRTVRVAAGGRDSTITVH